MIDRFYTILPLMRGEIVLDGTEAHHLAVVCRHREGDRVCLFNGDGRDYHAEVVAASKKNVILNIVEVLEVDRELPFRLEIAAPVPKGDRGDFLIEKLTELGADVVVPLLTHYSEVPGEGKTKFIRWGRILLSAMKQSRRVYRPELREPIRLRDLLAAEPVDAILVGHPAPPAITEAPGLDGGNTGDLPAPDGGKPVAVSPSWRTELLLVGPEGGWAPGEIEQFRKAGATFISLGPNRLRAETAAMALLTWRLSVLGVLGPFSFASRDADPDEITS